MMRRNLSFLSVLLLAPALSACTSGGGSSAAPMAYPRVATVASNTICPVMGKPVDPAVPTSQYRGQTIGFCCRACKPMFDANPAAYAANIR